LASAKKFAGAAELEIGFGDLETVGGADHGVEAGAGDFGLWGRYATEVLCNRPAPDIFCGH